jgi:hypothetical protein
MKLLKIILIQTCTVVALLTTGTTTAGVITSATSISSIDLNEVGGSFIDAINQSGLSAGYTSGVDDFTTYLASTPTHLSTPGTDWGSSITTGNLDFDLGNTLSVANIALWNFGAFSINAITSIQVFASNLSDFSVSDDLGIFAITIPSNPSNAQILNLTTTDARFIRFNILSNNGGSFSGLGEVAFDIADASVPLPSPIWLMVLGLPFIGSFTTVQKCHSKKAG